MVGILGCLGDVVSRDLLLGARLGQHVAGGFDQVRQAVEIGATAAAGLSLEYRERSERSPAPEDRDSVERELHGPIVERQCLLLAALVDGEERAQASAIADLIDELAGRARGPGVRVEPLAGRSFHLDPL